MRILKIMLITSVLCLLSTSSFGCASKSESAVTEDQIVTVQRGNLIVDITASGNLELSVMEDLAFDLFYPEGTVEEVLVEEGDPAEEGQLLAKVDISEWQDELTTLERQLATKERDLTQKEIDLINAETALEDAVAEYVWPTDIFSAREKVWAAERQVEEAQAILRGEKAIYDRRTGELLYYEELKTAWDIKVWTQKLSDAEEKLRTRQVELDKLLAESAADAKVADAEEKLRAAQAKLDKLLAASAVDTEVDTEELEELAIQRMQVELAQGKLEDAQKAQEELAILRLKVELARGKLEDAQKALEDAQEELDEANSKSPEITALFDGFITKVNVEGGDEIKTGTVAVQLADHNKFEADILVSEMDILQVKLGETATVQVDAMQGMSLPAKVTHIAPTATIQSGVVSYKVKVEIQSLEPVQQKQPEARQKAAQDIAPGQLPPRLQQAVEEGRFTREQAEEMMKQKGKGPPPGGPPPLGGPPPGELPPPGGPPRPLPTMISEDFQLREGLTVTVSIMVDERNDVLLVPNKAITRQEGESYVQVLKDGGIEPRLIKTGISDWQLTEVTEGLSEGEQILVPKATTTPTTPAPKGGPPMPFFGPPPPRR